MEALAMRGITIRDADERDVLTVDLKDILEIVGERAFRSRWVLSGVDATGEQAAEELHRLCDGHIPVDGQRLAELAGGVWEVIDGRFEAYDEGEDSPWLVVCAVDSSAYDVVTQDNATLEKVRSSYREVSDLPESAL